MKKAIVICVIFLLIGINIIPKLPTLEIKDSKINQPVDPEGLIAYWSFDEQTGDILHDFSNNNNHGVINGPTWKDNGISNGALLFNGINDFISLNDFTSSLNQGTVTAWIKCENQEGEKGVVFGKGVKHSNKPYIALGVDGGRIFFDRDIMGMTTLYQAYSADEQINDGDWHFLVWMSTGNENKFFIDGNEVTMNWKKGSSEGIWFNDQNTETSSFGVVDRKDNWCYFNGSIDEIRIYNRALSINEISTLYNTPTNFKFGLIIGKISNLQTLGNIPIFDAKKLRIITFSPFETIKFNNNEKIILSTDYFGFININSVMAFGEIYTID